MTGRGRGRTGPAHALHVRWAESPEDVEIARGLFREYGRWLKEHREVTDFEDSVLERGLIGFDREIDGLPGEYAPPGGGLVLGFGSGTPLACGALRRFGPGVAEMKRVYVRPGGRGRGLGRRIAGAVVRRAGTLGYDRLVLDTLPTMTAAIHLYQSIGFVPTASYWDHPVANALFFELPLPKAPRARPPGSRAPISRGSR